MAVDIFYSMPASLSQQFLLFSIIFHFQVLLWELDNKGIEHKNCKKSARSSIMRYMGVPLGRQWGIFDVQNPCSEPFPECFLSETGFFQMTTPTSRVSNDTWTSWGCLFWYIGILDVSWSTIRPVIWLQKEIEEIELSKIRIMTTSIYYSKHFFLS